MRVRRSAGAIALVTGLGLVGAGTTAPVASAGGSGDHDATVLASGLDGPFGLDVTPRGGVVTAESVSGQVTWVNRFGHQNAIINKAAGVAGAAVGPHHVFAAIGGPNEDGSPPHGKYPPSSVLRSNHRGHHVQVIADLLTYELRHNPDGQVQLVDGKPADALSNPFSMNASRYGLLVADGGANDVLRVNRGTGHVSTFFVPPTVKDVPACLEPGAQANPGTKGCDPVPTGIAVANGGIYVSTLGAEVPKAGRVYKLNPRNGKVLRVWKGLTAPTGIAVTPAGTIFVSEVMYGAPAGDAPPPPNFDPSSVGRITKIAHGVRTHAAVTMPTGLDYKDGRLYASAWSIASFLGIQHAGQIVRVHARAFH